MGDSCWRSLWNTVAESKMYLDNISSIWQRHDAANGVFVHALAVYKNQVDVQQLCDTLENVIFRYDDKLRRYPQRDFLGRFYWKLEDEFDIRKHVVDNHERVDGAYMEKLVSKFCCQGIVPRTSPWLVTIFHDYILDDGRKGTASLFRFHHCLADGFSMLRCMAQGFQFYRNEDSPLAASRLVLSDRASAEASTVPSTPSSSVYGKTSISRATTASDSPAESPSRTNSTCAFPLPMNKDFQAPAPPPAEAQSNSVPLGTEASPFRKLVDRIVHIWGILVIVWGAMTWEMLWLWVQAVLRFMWKNIIMPPCGATCLRTDSLITASVPRSIAYQPLSITVDEAKYIGKKSGTSINEVLFTALKLAIEKYVEGYPEELMLQRETSKLRRLLHRFWMRFWKLKGTERSSVRCIIWVSLRALSELKKPHSELPVTLDNTSLGGVSYDIPLRINRANSSAKGSCNGKVDTPRASNDTERFSRYWETEGAELSQPTGQELNEYSMLMGQIRRMSRALRGVLFSPEVFIASYAFHFLSWLPVKIMGSVIESIIGKVSISVSNLPGPQFPITIAGATADQLMFWASPQGRIGVIFSILSYNGKFVTTAAADSRLMPLAENRRLLRLFNTELEQMRNVVIPGEGVTPCQK